ncbi:MAG TPA: hypothetical protein VF772_23215 [Terriglobales bacterium]
MSDAVSTKSVYDVLRQYLRQRPDLGFAHAALDSVLEPLNPFDPKARRAPRRWFVLFVLLGGALAGCFLYFNNLI